MMQDVVSMYFDDALSACNGEFSLLASFFTFKEVD